MWGSTGQKDPEIKPKEVKPVLICKVNRRKCLNHTAPNPIFWKSGGGSGVRVAQMAGSDRPNDLKCFNIAFSGVIAALKWGRRLLNHTIDRVVRILRMKKCL